MKNGTFDAEELNLIARQDSRTTGVLALAERGHPPALQVLSPVLVTGMYPGMGYDLLVDGVKCSVPCVKFGVCLQRRTRNAKI
jgi:hypothetical protein